MNKMTNYLNVANITTFVVKMRTLIKNVYWNILALFYSNRNKSLHLREISRRIRLDQSALTRHLNSLTDAKILCFEKEANLKKFRIRNTQIKSIFPIYDENRFEALPLLKKNALRSYIEKLEERPIFVILFGSTAKGTSKEDSDIDIISVFNRRTNTEEAKRYAQAQTGLTVSEFQMTYKEFLKEVKLKDDNVIQAGIETGFPVYNSREYYACIYDE